MDIISIQSKSNADHPYLITSSPKYSMPFIIPMPTPNKLQTPYATYPSKCLNLSHQLAKQAHYP